MLLDDSADGLPVIVYWGPELVVDEPEHWKGLALASEPQRVSGGLDLPARLTLVPQESSGWQGTPGLSGHRGHRYVSTALRTVNRRVTASTVHIVAVDESAALKVSAELEILASGLFRQRLTVENLADDPYTVASFHCAFPTPADAREILDTTGRHLRERSPQRFGFPIGTHVRESRRGRPGADASLLLAAGQPGFGFERGRIHAVHAAWSGNHRLMAERTISGDAFLAGGELLLPGEMVLERGQDYSTPWVIGSWGEGMNQVADRFHSELRSRPQHPRTPRPVTLNTWEAVYFNHDLERLKALADRGAAVGVERYVLDDGWFQGRRDDTAGLGDWSVDAKVWPQGLKPLIDHVKTLGMQFGLWVEPEMVNLDSDLARAHPDWILAAHGRMPVSGRQQQVLNLADQAAYDHIFSRLDALLTENDIGYLKWDHNRDLIEAVNPATGAAAVHENVQALYRMLYELKRKHPDVEIESCASGGARVDLGILEYTDRIWTSDCIDPLERLDIQKYTGLLVPPELMGTHIGSPRSHSTGRVSDLNLRATAAFFGHLGIEWDISALDDEQILQLTQWIDWHKRRRHLLHGGRTVHADLPDSSMDVRGVVAQDKSEALFAFTQRAASESYPPGRITLPGLDPAGSYNVRLAPPMETLNGAGQSNLAWVSSPLRVSGQMLANPGIQAPVLLPEQGILIQVELARN